MRERDVTFYVLRIGFPSLVFAVIGFLVNFLGGILMALLLALIMPVVVAVGAVIVVQLVALFILQFALLYPRLKNDWAIRELGARTLLIWMAIGYVGGGSVPWIILLMSVAGHAG